MRDGRPASPRGLNYQRGLPFGLGPDPVSLRTGPAPGEAAFDAPARAAALCAAARSLVSKGDLATARARFAEAAAFGSIEAVLGEAALAALDSLPGNDGTASSLEPAGDASLRGEPDRAQVLELIGRALWSTPGAAAAGIPWLRAASDAGRADATYMLALAHHRGQGVERDFAVARRLCARAAEAGSVDAQFELSLMLAGGVGGKADARGARRWEERAAKAGNARACFNLAARLARARKPDPAGAVAWYARAAEGGHAEAAARLCLIFLSGRGVLRVEQAARRWHDRASELGWNWSAEEGAPG